MAKILVGWEKADWQSQYEVNKEIKKYINTARSFGIDDITIYDIDNSSDDNAGYSAPIIKSLDDYDLTQQFILMEPEDVIPVGEAYDFLDDNVVYVVWSEYNTIPFNTFANKKYLSIKTVPEAPLWSHVAIGIALANRYYKVNGFNTWQ